MSCQKKTRDQNLQVVYIYIYTLYTRLELLGMPTEYLQMMEVSRYEPLTLGSLSRVPYSRYSFRADRYKWLEMA